MNDSIQIAGYKTVLDWKNLRNKLRAKPNDTSLWNEAYELFDERLQTRYFKAIKDIKDNDKLNGEGFSITAILCSLIEFLESTYTGGIYRCCRDIQLEQYEYNRSRDKFISFFENRKPFNTVFTSTNGLAVGFYENVRCGLLHEASTKLNWIIRVDNNSEFYEYRNGNNVIDRNILESRIKEYLECYNKELVLLKDLQEAFIRKFNNIAGLHINY
jgi:hypothetical protein